MAIRGRVRAIPFAAAIAVVSAGPLAAAPPLTSPQELRQRDSWRLPEINPAPPRSRAEAQSGNSTTEPRANVAAELVVQEIPTGPQHRTPPSLGASVNGAERSFGAHANATSSVPGAEREQNITWVTILGDVARQGSYEIESNAITLAELMERCGGLLSDSECSLSIIRDGKFSGVPRSAQEVLRPGDLLVVLAAQPSQAPQDVRIGILGLPGCPVAVKVPRSYASVEGILSLAGQSHLHAGDIKVLLGGMREATGDRVVELTHGSVLVFDSNRITPIPGLDLRSFTNFYPAPKMPRRLERPELTRISLESSTNLQPSPDTTALNEFPPADYQGPAFGSDLGSPAGESFEDSYSTTSDISSLPSVEFLAPPTEMPSLRFPRTADASGETPIGLPEAESHIVPMPADIGVEPTSTMSGAKASNASGPGSNSVTVPNPIELPEQEISDTDRPSAADLAPTVFIGAILGGLTFFVLRRFRNRELFEAIRSRLFEAASRNRTASIQGVPAISGTPSEMLAALVADRLAFREEKVQLPAAMRIYGRSPALQRRRFDPVAASLAGPHFSIPAAVPSSNVPLSNEQPSVERSEGTQFRVDAAQSVKRPMRNAGAGTPFERALATLREDQQRDR